MAGRLYFLLSGPVSYSCSIIILHFGFVNCIFMVDCITTNIWNSLMLMALSIIMCHNDHILRDNKSLSISHSLLSYGKKKLPDRLADSCKHLNGTSSNIMIIMMELTGEGRSLYTEQKWKVEEKILRHMSRGLCPLALLLHLLALIVQHLHHKQWIFYTVLK